MPKKDPQFQSFRKLCAQYGLAATIQRFIVYQTLAAMKNHPTADMIYECLHPEHQTVSRMSVYRILDTFSKHRIIRRLNHPGSVTHYDAFMEPQHHLICVQCGEVWDIDCADGEDFHIPTANIPDGFQILDLTIDFQGLCSCCLAENSFAD